MIFHSTVSPRVDLIKRVIGLPGDRISYIYKVLYINGQAAKQTLLGYATTTDENHPGVHWTVKRLEENLLGVKHQIYLCADQGKRCPTNPIGQNFYNLKVPAGKYFMMGDNRDDSDDSRSWGFVPERNITGKGWRVLLSWDRQTSSIRWSQIWQKL